MDKIMVMVAEAMAPVQIEIDRDGNIITKGEGR